MICGVLCDKDGHVKRAWALIGGSPGVLVEDGDEVIEWENDHGANEPDEAIRAVKTADALNHQQAIHRLTTKDDALAHTAQCAVEMQQQVIALAALPDGKEALHCGIGQDLEIREARPVPPPVPVTVSTTDILLHLLNETRAKMGLPDVTPEDMDTVRQRLEIAAASPAETLGTTTTPPTEAIQ